MKLVAFALVSLLSLGWETRLGFAGACAEAPLAAVPATRDHAEVTGVVVVYTQQASDEPKRGQVKDWRMVDGKQRTAPVVQTIAPGLEVLQATGTRLDDASGKKLVEFARARSAVTLDPPKVAAVRRSSSSAGRRTIQTVSVQLDANAPADRFLIVFDATGKVARSWGRAYGETKVITVFSQGGCTVVADGTVESQLGDTVRLAWLDLSGRLSTLSPPIKVTADPAGVDGRPRP